MLTRSPRLVRVAASRLSLTWGHSASLPRPHRSPLVQCRPAWLGTWTPIAACPDARRAARMPTGTHRWRERRPCENTTMTGAYPSQEPPPGSVVAIDWGGPHQEAWTASTANLGRAAHALRPGDMPAAAPRQPARRAAAPARLGRRAVPVAAHPAEDHRPLPAPCCLTPYASEERSRPGPGHGIRPAAAEGGVPATAPGCLLPGLPAGTHVRR
jgi:hypothetical protein